MSLIRQIWLLLLGALLLAFGASVAVNVSSARDAMQTQLRLKNSDNATALAQVLSNQRGQRELMALAMTAQFDTGFYRRIRLTGADGQVAFERVAEAAPLNAPAWFVALAPIESVPGIAQVSDGWRALGAVEVVSQVAYAHDELWRGSVRSAFALGAVGLAAGLLAWVGVARIRRPLADTVEQAASLQRGEYLTMAEPRVPELQRVTRAMNAMVARLRGVFDAHAAQVEALRVQANCDALTGLSNRRHFMGQLAGLLQREDGAAEGGLVLVRVLELAEINRALGHEAVDRLLCSLAQVLQTYGERVQGAIVGRLNGSDFALALPKGGVAAESARSVVELMRAALAGIGGPVGVVAGVAEASHGTPLAELMGQVDLALARAESAGPFSCESAAAGAAGLGRFGETGWRDRIRAALAAGGARLAEYPVVDADARLLHLECPLRLQLQADGPFDVAAHWLPLAVRSRLTSEVDERALALVLEAIARDGRPRCVNLSPASLSDSGFAARLRGRLQAAPQAARAVWLEVSEAAALDHFDLVRELGRQLRPTGARFGLEHGGERLGRIERLFEAGLDYVKLDASVTHGVAADPGRAAFVEGLATMLHSLSIQVIAEGVVTEADATALWAARVDGITGPWVGQAAAPNAG